MAELLVARDYLQVEGERVRRINANYSHLAQTASASAKVIVESIGQWRIPESANLSVSIECRSVRRLKMSFSPTVRSCRRDVSRTQVSYVPSAVLHGIRTDASATN